MLNSIQFHVSCMSVRVDVCLSLHMCLLVLSLATRHFDLGGRVSGTTCATSQPSILTCSYRNACAHV